MNRLLFLHHGSVNSVSNETVSAGLGSAGQYGVVLIVLLIAGFFLWKIRKKKEL